MAWMIENKGRVNNPAAEIIALEIEVYDDTRPRIETARRFTCEVPSGSTQAEAITLIKKQIKEYMLLPVDTPIPLG